MIEDRRTGVVDEWSAMAALPPLSPASCSTTVGTPMETASSSGGDLSVRTACNLCRSKKVKCDKTCLEEGGCGRCKREGQECRYDVREPIGRPKKRKSKTVEYPSDDVYRRRRTSTSPRSPYGSMHKTAAAAAWTATSNLPSQAVSPSSSHSVYSTSHISSHGMTPSSSATTITPFDATMPIRASEETSAPTLSDLGLAAFLESLDTLEINTEDGLTPTMLETLAGPSSEFSTGAMNGSGTSSIGGHELLALQNAVQQPLLSALSLANMHGSTSYAVPADLSWADPSWLDRMPSTSSATSLPLSSALSGGLSDSHKPSHHPILPVSWPRGEEAGMGQAELRSLDGKLLQPAPAACCSSKRKSAPSPPQAKAPSKPCPKTGKPTCCCDSDAKDEERDRAPVSPEPHRHGGHGSTEMRVHCVPDPSGRGCTCLCDVSVALINVRATLRQQARNEEYDRQDGLTAAHIDDSLLAPDGSLSSSSQSQTSHSRNAASTLQLTLSASQAVAAQCACSASCPTCRTDPSTSLSASLLVSTALQIYVRAVRTLRQGFGAPSESSRATGASPSSQQAHHAAVMHANGSEWDVSIGQYKPKAPNARRIALFAMKLELRDLRDAIAKVSRAASGSVSGAGPIHQHQEGSKRDSTPTPPSSLVDGGVNPIDQVVIRKLHQQLGDLLRTVESIEEQQDAERNAQSVAAGIL